MNISKYHELREDLIADAFEVSNKKGQDYTQKSQDALKNFKTVAERTGLTAKQVLGVYMMKHQDAIASFIEHDGQLESEPIKERIIDNINYLTLLWGLIVEDEQRERTEDKETSEKTLGRTGMDSGRLRENGEVRLSEGPLQPIRSSSNPRYNSPIHPSKDEPSCDTERV